MNSHISYNPNNIRMSFLSLGVKTSTCKYVTRDVAWKKGKRGRKTLFWYSRPSDDVV